MTAPAVDRVAMRVVTFLGSAGILGLLGVIFLVARTTGYEKIDPSTVALVAGVSTIVGALFGSLGSILASTGKGAPQAVTVENTPADPVPTTPAPPPARDVALAGFDRQPGDLLDGKDAGHLAVVLLLIMGGALLFLVGVTGAVSGGVQLLDVAFMVGGLALAGVGVERAT